MDSDDWNPDRPETGRKPCLTQAELPESGKTSPLEPALQALHRRMKKPEYRAVVLGITDKERERSCPVDKIQQRNYDLADHFDGMLDDDEADPTETYLLGMFPVRMRNFVCRKKSALHNSHIPGFDETHFPWNVFGKYSDFLLLSVWTYGNWNGAVPHNRNQSAGALRQQTVWRQAFLL